MRFVTKLFLEIILTALYFNGSIIYAFSTFDLETSTPVNFYARLDAGGYSDVIKWGWSNYHPYGLHELLSGEWGAAIYYNGISTSPNAMWLTNQFLVPDWPTYCNFSVNSYNAWDDSNNPIVGYDTGRSVISNSDVEITIDYEIADLGVGHFSPLVYQEPNGYETFVRSERYVLLQTYTIKAKVNITGLEFYQMLHAHGADDYGPVVHCSYQTTSYPDALANYTPYNPVHKRGNFHYDITQWNNLDDPLRQPHSPQMHVDWVGFSSTVEPNVYECNYYEGHSGEPTFGTHKDIEQRILDNNSYSYGETAGAMGWFLPDLYNFV
jgi:hypothetical protein